MLPAMRESSDADGNGGSPELCRVCGKSQLQPVTRHAFVSSSMYRSVLSLLFVSGLYQSPVIQAIQLRLCELLYRLLYRLYRLLYRLYRQCYTGYTGRLYRLYRQFIQAIQAIQAVQFSGSEANLVKCSKSGRKRPVSSS